MPKLDASLKKAQHKNNNLLIIIIIDPKTKSKAPQLKHPKQIEHNPIMASM